MVILGIDPGTTRIGYGIIEKPKKVRGYGIIEIKKRGLPERLVYLERELEKLIKKYEPEVIAVEKLFFAKNKKTALEVAEARGVIILVAARHKIEIKEPTPIFVKQSVTGYGLADKKAVTKMVERLLNIKDLKKFPDDTADALANAVAAVYMPSVKN